MANLGGRPLKFQSVEEMQELIDAYFAACAETERPVTITGLALALDTTRETLCDYGEKDGFSDTIRKAKQRVEQYAEESLYLRAAAGPIFALKNFGWTDKQDINHGGQQDNPVKQSITVEFVASKNSDT